MHIGNLPIPFAYLDHLSFDRIRLAKTPLHPGRKFVAINQLILPCRTDGRINGSDAIEVGRILDIVDIICQFLSYILNQSW